MPEHGQVALVIFVGLWLHSREPVVIAGFRMRVSANWRIVFRFGGTDVCDVNLIDYH